MPNADSANPTPARVVNYLTVWAVIVHPIVRADGVGMTRAGGSAMLRSGQDKRGAGMKQINGIWVLDTLDELVAPAHTAVLLVDVQNDFCHDDGHFARAGKDMTLVQARLPGIVQFVAEAQAVGLPVVFIRQQTLPDNASDSAAWLRFKNRDGKAPDYTLAGSWGAELADGLRPGPADMDLVKFRPDAFHRTDLDEKLRARGIETVVVLGYNTEGCVESTVRAASYHDYYVVVVRDGVGSPNRVQHEGSMRLFEERYPLHDMAELLQVWRAAPAERAAS